MKWHGTCAIWNFCFSSKYFAMKIIPDVSSPRVFPKSCFALKSFFIGATHPWQNRNLLCRPAACLQGVWLGFGSSHRIFWASSDPILSVGLGVFSVILGWGPQIPRVWHPRLPKNDWRMRERVSIRKKGKVPWKSPTSHSKVAGCQGWAPDHVSGPAAQVKDLELGPSGVPAKEFLSLPSLCW